MADRRRKSIFKSWPQHLRNRKLKKKTSAPLEYNQILWNIYWEWIFSNEASKFVHLSYNLNVSLYFNIRIWKIKNKKNSWDKDEAPTHGTLKTLKSQSSGSGRQLWAPTLCSANIKCNILHIMLSELKWKVLCWKYG